MRIFEGRPEALPTFNRSSLAPRQWLSAALEIILDNDSQRLDNRSAGSIEPFALSYNIKVQAVGYPDTRDILSRPKRDPKIEFHSPYSRKARDK